MYGQPGRMVGRFTLHDDLTLFLFVFAADGDTLPERLDAEAMLRQRYCDGKWECPRIRRKLDETPELYFDRVSQIKMERWSRGRVALIGDAFRVSLLAGQGSALAMISAYVLADELAYIGGRHEQAFDRYEAFCGTISTEAERCRALCFRPSTKDPMGTHLRNQISRDWQGLRWVGISSTPCDCLLIVSQRPTSSPPKFSRKRRARLPDSGA